MINEEEIMKNFFGGLKKPESCCVICGNTIPKERFEKYPKTGFCSALCGLKWVEKNGGKENA